MEQLKEEHRDARGVSFIETLSRMCSLRLAGPAEKSVVFTTVAFSPCPRVGASTVVFSAIYSVFFMRFLIRLQQICGH